MTVFYDRLTNLCAIKKMSPNTVTRQIGLSNATATGWKKGSIPSGTAVLAIAELFDVSTDYLLGRVDDPHGSVKLPGNLIPIDEMPRKRLPLIGSVAAGEPIFADEDWDAYIDVDTPCKADYALRVQGDSMKPTYLSGDIIYVREQPDVPDGAVAVVLIDDSATLKHIYRDKYGVTLVSDNPAYPPMHFDPSDDLPIRILGIPVGYTRMLNTANGIVRRGMDITADDIDLESRVFPEDRVEPKRERREKRA